MNRANLIFHLDIQLIDNNICLFTLSQGDDSPIKVELEYHSALNERYEQWKQAYINYYEARDLPNLEPLSNSSMRADLKAGGMLNPVKKKKSQLQQTQSDLLDIFSTWLANGNLQVIRQTLEEACTKLEVNSEQIIDIFLTCHRKKGQVELAKLPWETWKISKKLERSGKIRIARTSGSRTEAFQSNIIRRSWARILAIWVEDKCLNLEQDINTLRTELKSSVEIQILRINSKHSSKQILQQIRMDIADSRGWDVLFFAGHSSEMRVGGGELQISAGFSIVMEDLKHELEQARKRGLQFAIFNSCNGLDIAESLLNLGLNQVVVMREMIADDAANEFLQQFALNLKDHHDVHTSVIKACENLSRSSDYLSAHLIPCIFRRPGSTLFKIPSRWRRLLRLLLLKRHEAIALLLITVTSLFVPLQQGLLDKRVYMQAIYNDIAIPVIDKTQSDPPPVVLLQIDENSIQQAMKESGTQSREPIPQSYLTKLITALADKHPKVVGIDYLLDSSQGNRGEITRKLGDAISTVTNQGTRFAFVMHLPENSDRWIPSLPEITGNNIASANSFLAYGNNYYIPILWQEKEPLPFAYWLTWLHRTCIQLKSQEHQAFCNLPNQQINNGVVEKEASKDVVKILPRLKQTDATAVGRRLNQQWLHPITDFSIAPNKVYEKITAEDFLKDPNNKLPHLSQQTVIIAAKYDGAGTDKRSDNFDSPSAIAYRTTQSVNFWPQMSGGEHHAYLFYLFLNQRLVVPVPDLWCVLVAALAGKGVVIFLQWRASKEWAQTTKRDRVKKLYQLPWFWALPSGTAIYSLTSLYLYYSSIAILLPIVMPTVVFWAYVLPPLMKREI
jgi:CHASE2 domain